MENLRQASRVDAQHFISFDVLNESGEVIQSGMTLSLDLSRRGIKVENRTTFPENASVRLHLAVGDEVVDVDGIVRHVEKIADDQFHIGIEFADIEEERLQKLAKNYPQILKQ